ncbi:hydrogenase maturation nickel metallochaperone HypA [Chrysiogenes arsenatis]|uniref:hydrogenase maturation nickel metallochaperone HypA n=1 Tax=Chrysiogenes arsenatis TaxID=309797 RepID=UPI00042A6D21|nr:hydrogenase maturation nickel metallochaperone HypA [Chrysiogenes arsenatis]
MHEFSLVSALLDQCEAQAAAHNATSVTHVTVKIGMMSAVEPELFRQAYETFRLGTLCAAAPLELIVQPLVLECHQCGGTSTVNERAYHCPQCLSTHITVLDGEEMYLMSLELETC